MTPVAGDGVTPRWQALRANPVQAGVWLALAGDYAARALPVQAGYCARQAALLAPALAAQLDTLPIGDWRLDRDMGAGAGPIDAAAHAVRTARLRQAVAACPGDWLGWLLLARALETGGASLADGSHARERARALEPILGETLHWLGRWRLAAGDADGAVAALAPLRDMRPPRYGSMMFLGEALLRTHDTTAAGQAFTRAALSANPDFLLELAARVFAHDYRREAIAIVRQALALRPGSVPHLLQLATFQHDTYALADCRATLARVRAHDPANREAARLATCLHGRMGDANSHYAALRRAYEDGADPLSRLASSIAMTALYHDELDAAAVAALHRDLCAPIAANYAPPAPAAFANPRSRGRRLKIGYVSGDLHRQHPVSLFMLPVLRRHDRRRVEVSVYHTGVQSDARTRMFQACSDRWIQADTLDDRALRRRIAGDGIDILVDLAGHTSTHRLGVFAMRAAPVQASFLGYPHSTGLPGIDWLVGDPVVSPAAHAHLFSEGIAQLPHSVFCWAPEDDYPLPPPRAAGAPLVFGSFNNLLKLSPRTIALWARVLHAVPDALLLLKSAALDDAGVRARFAALFGAHGIPPGRLLLRGPSGLDAMMREYGDVDIALDPLPYNGGTTTLQALWMGVPVVALEGGNFVGRMGASFLRTLGRPEWVAGGEDAYVAAAAALARDRDAVRASRARLRERMRASPLSDIDAYVRDFEALLHAMWNAHCDGDEPRLLAPFG